MSVYYPLVKRPCLKPLHWNEDCFTGHIRTTHDSDVFSDHTIRRLWRSFSYYAYHPFPRGGRDQIRVDESAFQRAVLLLALQVNDLLGTQEGDWFWRNNDEYFHRMSWERMMRSIALPCAVKKDEECSDIDVREAMVSDIMDVLSMTQPQPGLPNFPSPQQLEPAARRLYADKNRGANCIPRATKADSRVLVEVLMRLRLGDEKWGRFFHVGNLCVSSDRGAELAKTLVNESFPPGRQEGGDDELLSSDDITRLMDLLPNLHLRFLQLWSMIFQPKVRTSEPLTEPETSSGMLKFEVLLGTLSLFVPQAATLTRYGERLTMQDTRIAFSEISTSLVVENSALSLTHLIRLLSKKGTKIDIPSPSIVLFTNSDSTSNERTSAPYPVLGAYFPSALFPTDETVGKRLYSLDTGSSTVSMLFQVWPELRVTQLRGEGIAITEMLRVADTAQTVEVTELSLPRTFSNHEDNTFSDIGYWFGQQRSDSELVDNRKGLYINPTKQTLTLSLKPQSEDTSGFEKVSGSSSGQACETTVSSAVLHVFKVSGGVIFGEKREMPAVQDLSRYTRDEKAIGLNGKDLKARIEGFGSS